jgi:hypothetical protein
MVTHSKIVDPLYIFHKISNFRSLKNIFLIYIIIWLSLYALSVQSLSPPKPAGLDPPNFCRHAPNWLRNTDSQKIFFKNISRKIKKKKYSKFFLVKFFLVKLFHEIAERSVAISE